MNALPTTQVSIAISFAHSVFMELVDKGCLETELALVVPDTPVLCVTPVLQTFSDPIVYLLQHPRVWYQAPDLILAEQACRFWV